MAVKLLDVKFNDMSLNEKFGIGLLSYKKQSSSSRKTRGIDIPGRDGGYKVDSPFSAKSIELSVVVEAPTTEEVHKKIRVFMSWLSQQSEPKIVFTDDPNIFIRADLETSSEYYVTKGIDNALTYLTINLYQYDPFTYDNGVIAYSFEAIPGKTYDILNEGMYTPYNIKIAGKENSLTEYMSTSIGHSSLDSAPIASNIELNVNGIKQTFHGTIGYEDVLDVNGRDLTISKNGVSAITDWQGDIENLVYGLNTFSMSNTEGINLFVSIEYFRRWL